MIKRNIERIFKEIPEYVKVVAATKKRLPEEIQEAINAGIRIVGENYVQEAEKKLEVIGRKVEWHLIGHLQKNKVKKAIKIFDVIQTLDSLELAMLVDRECKKLNKIMLAMVEVNIAKEPQKAGVFPEDLEGLVKEVSKLENIKLAGLMTMGPYSENPEGLRPYFRKTKTLFEKIKNSYKNLLDWKYLSMGMSSSYKVAIEEGANMIRLGTAIFGPRMR